MPAAPDAFIPAAVREVQVEHVNAPLGGLDGYTQALVVFRHGVAVVGQAWMPVVDGRVAVAALRNYLPRLAWPIWQHTVAAEPPPSRPLPSASVAVCTRDRAEDMARCLPSLDRLAAAGHEVLVVDNRPSDERTRELVALYPRVRYVRELRPGLDAARNRALREARGEVVAFTDDDALVDEGWLDALRARFADPIVALVTGITMPLELETPAQIWFEQTNGFGRGFVPKTYDIANLEPLGAGKVGAGVNMAIRRAALRQIGLFDEALDGGTAAMSGGDQEFFYRVLSRGYRAAYEPAALVWHRHRREWEALQRCIEGYGVGLFAWWTRAFLVENDWTVLKTGAAWFVEHHLREAARALLRRPGAPPRDLALAELRGALAGPGAYLRARAELRRRDSLAEAR
jgi:GT2 family glycosyltransferase